MRRHNRTKLFEDAISLAPELRVKPDGWVRYEKDPNHPTLIAYRAQVLENAWRPPVRSRVEFIRQRSLGRDVLDLGCVAHDPLRIPADGWLHRDVAEVANSCLGIDILESGIEVMRSEGYNAIVHDISQGADGLQEYLPVDMVIAGEIIEHMGSPQDLFVFAAQALKPGGELIVTTPNPYAPKRVWAGQRGITWENVDHILYALPSGIAELAERTGLELVEAFTAEHSTSPEDVSIVRKLKRRIKGSGWLSVGLYRRNRAIFKSNNQIPHILAEVEIRSTPGVFVQKIQRILRRPSSQFLGETFIYVIRRKLES